MPRHMVGAIPPVTLQAARTDRKFALVALCCSEAKRLIAKHLGSELVARSPAPAMSFPGRLSVRVAKERFKFNAAHFIA